MGHVLSGDLVIARDFSSVLCCGLRNRAILVSVCIRCVPLVFFFASSAPLLASSVREFRTGEAWILEMQPSTAKRQSSP